MRGLRNLRLLAASFSRIENISQCASRIPNRIFLGTHLRSSTTSSLAVDISPKASTLPIEFGGDVNCVVHKSLDQMIPCDITGLPGVIFNAPVRKDLVHRVVHWQLAKRRAGTAKTKNRSEVSGSGRKIRPQKGTGRSRQGAITSPIFRGGGRAHGPVPRSYDYPLPMNVRRYALRSVLSSKLQCGQLWIVESTEVPDAKTRNVVSAIQKLQWKSVYVIDHRPDAPAGVNPSFMRASHNIRPVLVMNVLGLNVYDALSFDMLVLTRAALEELSARFAKYDYFV